MAEFDYEALWDGLCTHVFWPNPQTEETDTQRAAAYLREQIEAAFVAREEVDAMSSLNQLARHEAYKVAGEAKARAEAAEADVQRLTEQGLSEVRNLIGTIQWILEDPVTNAEKYRAKLADARASMPSVQ